jgi:hypothetical protein
VAFFKASLPGLVERFISWQSNIFQKLDWKILEATHFGEIDGLTELLIPRVRAPITKHLFFSTKSEWIGYLDNGPNGTDSSGIVSVLSEAMQIEAVRIVLSDRIPDADCPRYLAGPNSFKALIFSHHTSARESDMTVFSANDGGRWKHASYGGLRQSFEIDARVDKDHPMSVGRVADVCASFGLHPLIRSWYGDEAVLVTKSRDGGEPEKGPAEKGPE